MHGAVPFIEDLALVFCVAAVVTILFQRLRQPVVLGYLLAGTIVGPYLPIPIFADQARVQMLSELGVILVMFSIGLEFSLTRLVRVLPTAGVAGGIQITAMLWLGYTMGHMFGLDWRASLFVGAMISVSSTMIVARVFANHRVDKRLSDHVFGVLIVQDLAAILLITVLTTIASGAGLPASEVAKTAAQLALFLVGSVLVGLLVIPRMVREAHHKHSRETLLITAVGICFGVALLAERLGYSVALGAFLAGMLIAESGKRRVVEHLVAPLRDAFAAVFFVAIGMLVDPDAVVEYWTLIAALVALVLVGQTLFISVGTFLTGKGVHISIRAGMSLAQIGEFSFIITGVGVSAGVVPPGLFAVAVAVSVVTTFTTPFMVKISAPLALWFERRLPKPLQTFGALYGSWLEAIRAGRNEQLAGRMTRLRVLLVLEAAVILGAILSQAIAQEEIAGWLVAQIDITRTTAVALSWVAMVLVVVPIVVDLLRVSYKLAFELATRALPPSPHGVDLAAAPRRALVVALQLAIVLLVGIPVVALTQPFIPLFFGGAVLLAFLVLLGVSFWRSTTNLQGHVRAGAEVVLEFFARQRVDEGPDNLDEILPGLGSVTPVQVTKESESCGSTLADINLRGLTGATVLAIQRAGQEDVSVPTGKETLLDGDVLMIAGTREAIAAAEKLLGAEPRT